MSEANALPIYVIIPAETGIATPEAIRLAIREDAKQLQLEEVPLHELLRQNRNPFMTAQQFGIHGIIKASQRIVVEGPNTLIAALQLHPALISQVAGPFTHTHLDGLARAIGIDALPEPKL